MFARIITLAVCTLISTVAFAQEPPRCATAKSAQIEQTADGKTIIRIKTIQVCR